ncbi:MAG: hypothetical protein JO037_22920 [Actinobacteria bacterium]|nr:hypothetical protein [Actinomycetota bacterium]
MPSIWNRSRTGSPRAARWRWRLAAGLVTPLAALGLATAFTTTAYAQVPKPGFTPGVAAAGAQVDQFFTATDGTVWVGRINGTPGPLSRVSNGLLTSGPSAILVGTTEYVFGRGREGNLWWAVRVGAGPWSNWGDLGGNIISKPGAVFRGPLSSDYSVFAPGTDGAVWALDHTSGGWGRWHSIGGRLLGGTGPAAAAVAGGTWVLVVGTNRELYIQSVPLGGHTSFSPVGGQTTADPGLAGISNSLVGFARGTNNGGWYHRFLTGAPAGWHSMGGVFTSGLSAAASGFTTYTVGLGTDGQVWRNVGAWTATASQPPAFSGWVRVSA